MDSNGERYVIQSVPYERGCIFDEPRRSERPRACIVCVCERARERGRGNNPSTGIDVVSVLSLAGVSATRAVLHGGKVSSLVKGDVATLTSAAVDAR